jgi:hypothetical protein
MVVSMVFGFSGRLGLPSQPWVSAVAAESLLRPVSLFIAGFCVLAPLAAVADSVGILLDQNKKASTWGLILVAGAATTMVIATFCVMCLLPHGSDG